MKEINIKIPDTNEQLEITIKKISTEKERYKKYSALYEKLNTLTIFFIAIFASASPALVAFQSNNPGGFWQIPTIILIAVGGSLTTLQSGFKFSEKKGRYKITELKLIELESEVIINRYNELNSGNNQMDIYSNLKRINENATKKLFLIIKDHIQGEIAIITNSDKGKE